MTKEEMAKYLAENRDEYPEYTDEQINYVINRWMGGDYDKLALMRAEDIGVYEYAVSGNLMTYWSFYPECGFIYVTHNLDTGVETREVKYPWYPERKIPPELLAEDGSTLYNYMEG